LILAGFFDPDEAGFYVDVGANEPSKDSVTKLFYDRGWHGINIEPLRRHYQQLLHQRPRDINLNIGAGERRGKLTLREYTFGTGLSTMSDRMKDEYLGGKNQAAIDYVDHSVEVKKLATIFKECEVSNISFMKVDVEGLEYEVLAGNDWKQYRPEVICIEANHIEKDWRKLLKGNEYTLAFFDGLNEYYVDSHKPERLKHFSYVDAIVSKEPIVMYRLLPKVEEYAVLKRRTAELERELALKNQSIVHLEGAISEITPLRRHLRRQIKQRLRSTDQKILRRLGSSRQYNTHTLDRDNELLEAVLKADRANFANYNETQRRTAAQRAYLVTRRAGIEAASRLLRMRKV
jgi:FkbM family methyltransferase